MENEDVCAKKSKGKSKSTSKSKDDPPKRRGPPAKFKGLRLEFLKKQYEAYADPNQRFQFSDFAADYWTRVSWRNHNLDVEVDPEVFNNASVTPDPDGSLTPEETAEKAKVMLEMTSKFKNWFQNTRTKLKGPSNVWEPFLKQMVAPATIPRRKSTVVQYLMSHKDFVDEVDETFGERVEDSMNQGQRLVLRGEIAQEIFDALDEAKQAVLVKENDAARAAVLATASAKPASLAPPTAEQMKIARENIASVSQPFLDGLEDRTGGRAFLICLCAPEVAGGKYSIELLQSNGVAGKAAGHTTASKHDLAGYTTALQFFMGYDQKHPLFPAQQPPSASTPDAPSASTSTSAVSLPPSQPPSSPPLVPSLTDALSRPESSPEASIVSSAFDTNFFAQPGANEFDFSEMLSFDSNHTPATTPSLSSKNATPTPTSNSQALKLPQPMPRPVPRPAPIISSSRSPESIADDLLLFPRLSNMIISLAQPLRETEYARVMALSDQDKEREEDAVVFPLFNSNGYQTTMPASRSPSPIPSLRSPSKGTPSRAARIALKYVNASSEPPNSLPSPTSNISSSGYNSPALQPQIALPPPFSSSASPSRVEPADLRKAPAWLKNSYETFSLLPYGTPWIEFLNQLVELERGYGFKSPAKALDGRIDLVTRWTKEKLEPTHKPDIIPINEVVKQFWQWWSILNAPVRISNREDGRLTPGEDGGDIAIDNLRVPGKNGFIGIMYTLRVWRGWIGDGDTGEWDAALQDVHWVARRLCEMTYYTPALEDIPTLKRALPSENEGPSKRARKPISYKV